MDGAQAQNRSGTATASGDRATRGPGPRVRDESLRRRVKVDGPPPGGPSTLVDV